LIYLLDTCVVSELIARRPEPRVLAWIDSVDPDRVHLSVLTIGEIWKGIEKMRNAERKKALESWLQDDLLVRFQDRIVSLDIGILTRWGVLTGGLEAKGTPMPAIDSLLAATALQRSFVLVTRNESDFLRSGAEILNPWAQG
jgi:predicted nucleic acid-binding protein